MQNALVPFDNQNLFDDGGHLTGSGLDAMGSGRLDELGSLEAAEHISFCNTCLRRYTNWLEAVPQTLLAPAPGPGAPGAEPDADALHPAFSPTNTFPLRAAVILAFSLWNFGVFDFDPGNAQQKAERLSEGPRFSVSQSIQQVIGGIGKTIDQVLEELQACVQSGFAQLKDQHPDTNQQSGGTQPAKGE